METPSYLKIILGFLAFILVGNVVLLDYIFVSQKREIEDLKTRVTHLSEAVRTAVERNYLSSNPSEGERALPSNLSPPSVAITPSSPSLPPEGDISCPQACLPMIDSAITAYMAKKAPVPVLPEPTLGLRGEYFINLGSGSVLVSEASSTNWKTLETAQATFDISNFANVKSVTLELFLRAEGSGEVHARLFDSTTPAIIWGSEVSVASNTSTYKTVPINLTPGNKTYKIQMYSLLNTGYLDQARIHIVTR